MCVCCPTQKQLIKPGAFVNDSRLTVWFSVPSTAVFMRRFGVLNPGMYPRLRSSLFCGEALPLDTAREWALAAAKSLIENIYGPHRADDRVHSLSMGPCQLTGGM